MINNRVPVCIEARPHAHAGLCVRAHLCTQALEKTFDPLATDGGF